MKIIKKLYYEGIPVSFDSYQKEPDLKPKLLVQVDKYSSSSKAAFWYEVDFGRTERPRESGELTMVNTPFFGVKIELCLSIRPNGDIKFNRWRFVDYENQYLHVVHGTENDVKPTAAMQESLSGLLSGRLNFEGIHLPVGGTPQDICNIDISKEEKLTGKKIYLNI